MMYFHRGPISFYYILKNNILIIRQIYNINITSLFYVLTKAIGQIIYCLHRPFLGTISYILSFLSGWIVRTYS